MQPPLLLPALKFACFNPSEYRHAAVSLDSMMLCCRSGQLAAAVGCYSVLPSEILHRQLLAHEPLHPAFCVLPPSKTTLIFALVGAAAAVDSWDCLRDGAVACLMKLPSPLPGLGTPEALLPQLRWACQLLRSPRVRESDAGSTNATASGCLSQLIAMLTRPVTSLAISF